MKKFIQYMMETIIISSCTAIGMEIGKDLYFHFKDKMKPKRSIGF